MEFQNFLYLSLGSFLVTGYKVANEISKGNKLNIASIFAEICIGLALACMVVPFGMKKYDLDIYGGLFAVFVLSLFSKILISLGEKYIEKKGLNKINNL